MSLENNAINKIDDDQLGQVSGGDSTTDWYANQQAAWEKKWEEDAEKKAELEELRRKQMQKQQKLHWM